MQDGGSMGTSAPWPVGGGCYNTGLHVSTNGRAFAQMLEDLVAAWPVPVEELSILAHSMGGLVARSAHHYASAAGYAWPRKLRKLLFLGTPHHGVPLIGDGLVPVASALGDHRDSGRRLTFPRSHQWTTRGTSHLGLLSSGQVYERIRGWFAE